MTKKKLLDNIIIEAEDIDWNDRESNDFEVNLEEVVLGEKQVSQNNCKELLEATPYFLIIIVFCVSVFYFCS